MPVCHSCIIDWILIKCHPDFPLSANRTPPSVRVSPAKASPRWARWLSVAPISLKGLRMIARSSFGRGNGGGGGGGRVCCVCLLPAITSFILGSIIHVRRIITLARSPFASSDITVNPLNTHTHKNMHTMLNRPPRIVVLTFYTHKNIRTHCTYKNTFVPA